jgi:hypothetical protein
LTPDYGFIPVCFDDFSGDGSACHIASLHAESEQLTQLLEPGRR